MAKRLRKARKRDEPKKKASEPVQTEHVEEKMHPLLEFYDKNYKKLLIIPFVILLLAMAQIGFQIATTGDFISKGVALKGGSTITIPTGESFDLDSLKAQIIERTSADAELRQLKSAGMQTAIVIESELTDSEDADRLIQAAEEVTGVPKENYSVDIIGSSLGDSFFREILFALLIAFVFMGGVVFFYFRTIIPSAAVILAAFSNMVVTVAIINVMGMKLSTAGIAAFLMMIGYSIDTDILLSTRLLKRKEGTIFERIIQSAKTGLTMSFTTLIALIVIIVLSKSEVLTQIMTILFIGLVIDLINTWIQNVGILRLYLERKND